jgi:hypothetical protein
MQSFDGSPNNGSQTTRPASRGRLGRTLLWACAIAIIGVGMSEYEMPHYGFASQVLFPEQARVAEAAADQAAKLQAAADDRGALVASIQDRYSVSCPNPAKWAKLTPAQRGQWNQYWSSDQHDPAVAFNGKSNCYDP